jgi:hypothetical protein
MFSKSLKQIMILSFVALALTACGNKKNSSEKVIRAGTMGRVSGAAGYYSNNYYGNNGTTGYNYNNSYNGVASGQYQNNVWTLVGTQPNYQLDFYEMVKRLIAPTMDPKALGNVSGVGANNTGVYMQLFVELNSDRSINTQNSLLRMAIRDDYVGQSNPNGGGAIKEIPIVIQGLTTNNYNTAIMGGYGNSQVSLKFADTVGEITVEGMVSGSSFSGSVKFRNYSPKGDNMEYVLGGFTMNTCAAFNCK